METEENIQDTGPGDNASQPELPGINGQIPDENGDSGEIYPAGSTDNGFGLPVPDPDTDTSFWDYTNH